MKSRQSFKLMLGLVGWSPLRGEPETSQMRMVSPTGFSFSFFTCSHQTLLSGNQIPLAGNVTYLLGEPIFDQLGRTGPSLYTVWLHIYIKNVGRLLANVNGPFDSYDIGPFWPKISKELADLLLSIW